MKHIKTLLVDDEPRGLTSLQKLIQLNCSELEIVACCSSADEAREMIEKIKGGKQVKMIESCSDK